MEFLSRCGERFLRCYHRAWIDSPDAIAIAAVDDHGRILGVLLGSVHPEAHFRAIVRRGGPALAFRLLARAISDRHFAKELVGTRAVRYTRGLFRMLRVSLDRRRTRGARLAAHTTASDIGEASGGDTPELMSGEVTHVMVQGDAQGTGVGRALLEGARTTAEVNGLDELVLVTPPDMGAARFYEHLGWQQIGELTSRSGEPFLRYRLSLH